MLCALVQDSVVVDIQTLDDAGYQSAAKQYQIVLDIDGISPPPQIGWLFDGSKLVSNGNEVWHITRLKFRQRFTNAELLGIFQAASTNYMIQALLDNQRISLYTDLLDPALIGGIEYLVSLGLLTQARATQILTTPPSESEVYTG